jgi:hypothetical protein
MNRISDDVREQIREDREQKGFTLSQLVDHYGGSKSTIALIIKGCDSSKVMRASSVRRVVVGVKAKARPDLSKTDLGEAARQMICARLMLNGVKVFRPMTEDTPTDLLVLKGDGTVAKCQCKYAFPVNSGCHVLPLCSVRKNGHNTKAVKHRYTQDEVDFFLGYCQDNDAVYVIPFQIAGSRLSLRLWVLRSRQGSNGDKGFNENEWRGRFELLK